MQIVAWGCVGGLFPDILRFVKGRYEKPGEFYKYWNFWLGLFLLVALGGLAAWLAGATDVKGALAYGFAAPEVIAKLFSQQGGSAAVDRGEALDTQDGFSLRRWWTG
jgi:hypothetical protein